MARAERPHDRNPESRGAVRGLFATLVLGTVVGALPTACYRPQIPNGTLRCGTGSVCPDGYSCAVEEGHCWLNGTNPDVTDASAMTGADVSCPPTPLCPARESTPCDPVCQSGTCNWCKEKCSYSGTGDIVCSSKDGGGTLLTGATCTVKNGGRADQSDTCAPGNICLYPEAGAVGARCFALCSSSTDCAGNVACGTLKLPPSASGTTHVVHVCDVVPDKCDSQNPASCCDPTLGSGGRACSAGSFCYLVDPDVETGDSRTSCELATGTQGKNESCSSSHDCLQKLTCGRDGLCHVICTAAQACSSGTCMASGKQYGYCWP